MTNEIAIGIISLCFGFCIGVMFFQYVHNKHFICTQKRIIEILTKEEFETMMKEQQDNDKTSTH